MTRVVNTAFIALVFGFSTVISVALSGKPAPYLLTGGIAAIAVSITVLVLVASRLNSQPPRREFTSRPRNKGECPDCKHHRD